MEHVAEQKPTVFVDRRGPVGERPTDGVERRQFSDSTLGGNPDAMELAEAVDQYKLRHRRRFITFEELYDVIALPGVIRPKALGFKTDEIRYNIWLPLDGKPVRWTGQPS